MDVPHCLFESIKFSLSFCKSQPDPNFLSINRKILKFAYILIERTHLEKTLRKNGELFEEKKNLSKEKAAESTN